MDGKAREEMNPDQITRRIGPCPHCGGDLGTGSDTNRADIILPTMALIVGVVAGYAVATLIR